MKITIYGSHLCGDTLYALMKLREEDADYEYRDITANLAYLKEFLLLKDNNPLYEGWKEREGLGIPLFILENGTQTKDLDQVLALKQE